MALKFNIVLKTNLMAKIEADICLFFKNIYNYDLI